MLQKDLKHVWNSHSPQKFFINVVLFINPEVLIQHEHREHNSPDLTPHVCTYTHKYADTDFPLC